MQCGACGSAHSLVCSCIMVTRYFCAKCLTGCGCVPTSHDYRHCFQLLLQVYFPLLLHHKRDTAEDWMSTSISAGISSHCLSCLPRLAAMQSRLAIRDMCRMLPRQHCCLVSNLLPDTPRTFSLFAESFDVTYFSCNCVRRYLAGGTALVSDGQLSHPVCSGQSTLSIRH